MTEEQKILQKKVKESKKKIQEILKQNGKEYQNLPKKVKLK